MLSVCSLLFILAPPIGLYSSSLRMLWSTQFALPTQHQKKKWAFILSIMETWATNETTVPQDLVQNKKEEKNDHKILHQQYDLN